MSLLIRINLAVGVLFALAALTTGFACQTVLQANAERQSIAEAGLMMDSALAIREYTASEILPLLSTRMQSEFLPQSVPLLCGYAKFLETSRCPPPSIRTRRRLSIRLIRAIGLRIERRTSSRDSGTTQPRSRSSANETRRWAGRFSLQDPPAPMRSACRATVYQLPRRRPSSHATATATASAGERMR